MSRKIVGIVCLSCALAFTGFVHAQIDPTMNVDRGETYVPTPAAARAASLGFHAVVADYYWLQAVAAAGGESIIDADAGRHIGKLIDVVTTLDPWVDHPYRFAAIWMTEGEENVRTAIALMHRAIEYHPDDWRNWFYIGFDHFYYLGENEKAADALETASGLEGAPAYLPRLVARLRSASADIEVSEVFLRQLLDSTDDEERRQAYQAAIDEIEIERKARFLDRARDAYRKLTGRDIERVEDLVESPYRVIEGLPRPYPDMLSWTMDPSIGSAEWVIGDDGTIVSTYYGTRYEVHYSPTGSGIVARGMREAGSERADDATGVEPRDDDGDEAEGTEDV